MAVTAFLYSGPQRLAGPIGRDLYNKVLPVRAALDRADKALAAEGFKATKACFLGTDQDLARPSIAGPALLALSYGLTEALRSRRVLPQLAAGYGWGEIIALACLGVMPFEEALLALRRRGACLEAAWAGDPFHVAPVGGLSRADLEEKLAALPKPVLVVAEDSREDCVVAAEEGYLKKILALLASRGAKIGPSTPGYAWPHPSFEGVADQVAGLVAGIKLERKAACDLFSAREGAPLLDMSTWPVSQRDLCVKPVLFSPCAAAMRAAGMDTAVEVGPGQALSSLVHKLDAGIRVLASHDAKSLSSALKLAV